MGENILSIIDSHSCHEHFMGRGPATALTYIALHSETFECKFLSQINGQGNGSIVFFLYTSNFFEIANVLNGNRSID